MKLVAEKMPFYDKDAKAILGEKAWDILCRSVSEGRIEPQQMKDIAFKLSMKVGGSHARRMQERTNEADWPEMRRVIGDWYCEELYDMSRKGALEKLTSIFESADIDLRSLAWELKKIPTSQPKDDAHCGASSRPR